MEFHLVDDVDEVLRIALEGAPTPMTPGSIEAAAGTAPSGNIAH